MSGEQQVHVRPRHRMVDRMAAILESVARSGGMSLTEIAREVGAPVSTCQGLVNGLVATGYLDESNRRYTLGVAPYVLNLLAGRTVVNRVSHEDLVAVHDETGLTTILSVAVGQDVIYIDHVSDDPTTAYLAESYVRRSLIRTSNGWLLLADYERRDLWSYLRSLPPEDDERVSAFLEALPRIQETGVCVAPNVSETAELDGISVAVRENGRTAAAIGLVGTHEVLTERSEELVTVLLKHAAEWHGRG